MGAVLTELLMYVIKFVCMVLCAAGGIAVGMKIKKKKSVKAIDDTNEQ